MQIQSLPKVYGLKNCKYLYIYMYLSLILLGIYTMCHVL